jgi:hypothetical protein
VEDHANLAVLAVRAPGHLPQARREIQASLKAADTPLLVEEMLQERTRYAHEWLLRQALPAYWWVN